MSEPPDRLLLQLEGFEGPMDLLLDLAQKQKVDLAQISILAIVEQYLAIVQGAVRVRIELAADWLVMAAWLTWLKSRLLLPPDQAAAEDGELAADVLAHRIRGLQEMRAAAAWLDRRPQLGRDVFPRGAPEDHTETDRTGIAAKLPGLLRAYVAARRGAAGAYAPARPALWTVQDALARLTAMLGGPGRSWVSLEQFLPAEATPLRHRAALASTLLAGLELARDGRMELRQDRAFGTIECRGRA